MSEWYGDGETTGRKEVAAATMQWHGMAWHYRRSLQASSSKLGRPPYGQQVCICVICGQMQICMHNRSSGDDKVLGTLACLLAGSVSWLTFG